MVWRCMSYNGIGNLVIIRGNMDRFMYKRMPVENLESSRDKIGLSNNYTFQQNNDPKHKSKYVMDFFKENDVDVMSWPSQSPDMIPIEHLWDYVKWDVRKCQSKNIKNLEENIRRIWNEIPKELCKKFIDTMPKRVEVLVRAKGRPTEFWI